MAKQRACPALCRRVTYRLYPTAQQEAAMLEMRRLHQQLYNAALEERIKAYGMQGISRSFSDQCKALTLLRAERPEYKALNAQASQTTIKRVDLAFAAF